jgi:hypothetical protein
MPDPEGMLTYTDYTCSFAKVERDPGCCGWLMLKLEVILRRYIT